MKNNIVKLIIFFLITNFSNSTLAEEKVVFSINEKSFTTIDLEKRINYHLFINNIEISDNNQKYFEISKKFLTEEILLREYIKDLNIEVSKKDINKTFINVIDFVANGNKFHFDKLKVKYEINDNEINEYVKDEIINNIVNQFLSRQIKIEENKELRFYDYIEYKINNLILYKSGLKEKDYINEKKYIIEIFKDNNFKESAEIINKNNFNTSFYIDKWVNLDKINSEIKKLIIKSNFNEKIFYENNQGLFVLEKTEKKFPKINIDYSFVQIISNEKKDLNKYTKLDNVCDKNVYENINDENIKIKYFDKINYNDLNKVIFDRLDEKNNKLIMSNNNNHNLIILCEFLYSENDLKNYIINNEYMDEIIVLRRRLIEDLKKKYNFIEYN